MEIVSLVRITCCRCRSKTMEYLNSVMFLLLALAFCGLCVESKVTDSTVFVKWQLSDTSAPVGKLFQFHIPGDTFEGLVKSYQVIEHNKGILPDWLHFDEKNHVLSGIPMSKDKGQYVLEVTAYGENRDKAVDVFSIFVKDDQDHISSVKPLKSMGKTIAKEVNCGSGSPLTAVTIVVDTDFDQLYPEDRLKFVQNFAKHLNLAPEMMKFNPVAGRSTFDGSALVAGPGDAKTARFGGVFTSWLVGCGNVETDHMPVLQKVEQYSADGSMARDIGHPVIEWHVSNTRTENSNRKRNRRAVMATPTPVMSVPPPTGVLETVMMTKDLPSMIKPTMMIDATPTMDKTDMEIKPTKMTDVPIAPTDITTPKPSDCSIDDGNDRAPFVFEGIKPVTIDAGEFKKIEVPRDAFKDCEDGDTYSLTIDIFGKGLKMAPEWATYNREKNIIELLPTNKDAGVQELQVVVRDRAGKIGNLNLEVRIEGIESEPQVEFDMKLDNDYSKFKLKDRISIKRKIGQLFGDKRGRTITITKIVPGSTIVGWTFNDLSTTECSEKDINNKMDTFLHKNMSLKSDAKDILEGYKVMSIHAFSGGSCKDVVFDKTAVDQVTDKPGTDTVDPTVDPNPTDEPTGEQTPESGAGTGGDDEDDSNIWITTVIPAIVVVVFLLIALLVACCLYRRRRKGKMSPNDQNMYVNKGTPVIFQTELSEKPTDTSSQPLILPEDRERQPNPPEYQPNNHTNIDHDRTEDLDETADDEATLFRPPPPVTSSNETKPPRPAVQTGMSPTNIGP